MMITWFTIEKLETKTFASFPITGWVKKPRRPHRRGEKISGNRWRADQIIYKLLYDGNTLRQNSPRPHADPLHNMQTSRGI